VIDDRARRSAVLNAAAKTKSRTKTAAAEQAIRALVKRGEAVTFQAVCRKAGVSQAFLYKHHDLRSRIEQLRDQAQSSPRVPRQPTDTEAVVFALTSQIDQLKKQHRQEVQALRAALKQAHGENLNLRRELIRRGLSTTS
jgi:Family of unknown function (DUF6262)